MKIDLVKRNFLGYSYFHIFINDETGEETAVETTQAEYERLGQPDGAQFNPVLEGHTWKCSLGGAVKVDSPTGLLKDREYTVVGENAFIALRDRAGGGIRVSAHDVVNDSIEYVDSV